MNRLFNTIIVPFFTFILASTSLAQRGSKPETFATIPAEVGGRIIVGKDEAESGVGVRFHHGKEEFISVAQSFVSSKAETIDGVGLKLFPNESNLQENGSLNYELRFYEVEGESEGRGRGLSIPLKVVPFFVQGEFRESKDYLYIRLPEPLPVEAGKTYAFEVAVLSKNSTRLTIAIGKRVTAPDPSEGSGYMIKGRENRPIETIPVAPSGYSLAFFLTAIR